MTTPAVEGAAITLRAHTLDPRGPRAACTCGWGWECIRPDADKPGYYSGPDELAVHVAEQLAAVGALDGEAATARRRWAAWLVESAAQADDLTEFEAQGMRIAATHLLDDDIAARVARIDGLDDEWSQRFTERLNDRIEAHRFAVRTVRAAAAPDGEDETEVPDGEDVECPCCLGDPDTVCATCKSHACWAGRFMCGDADVAGIEQADTHDRSNETRPSDPPSLHTVLAVGIERGLRDTGCDLLGCTASILTGWIIRELRQAGLFVSRSDGEDVPARFDAAAEALEALHSHGLGYELRQVADQLRDGDGGTPELRAAVAAALALPTTEREK